ncbi:membrane protein hemolysin III [Cutibacterium acnes JCM 18918]|nr:membrane protein hemolysin III [Cutibacterium acnes JCM 18918]
MATGCSSKTKNRSSVLPKPRLRGWVHTVMAPLILLAGVGLMMLRRLGETDLPSGCGCLPA